MFCKAALTRLGWLCLGENRQNDVGDRHFIMTTASMTLGRFNISKHTHQTTGERDNTPIMVRDLSIPCPVMDRTVARQKVRETR